MKSLRWVQLFLEFIMSLVRLSKRLRIRKEKRMKKQKENPEQQAGPIPSQAPKLVLKKTGPILSQARPPFPPQKKKSPEKESSLTGGPSSAEAGAVVVEDGIPTPLDIEAAGAIPDLIFRGVHLAYKDIPALSEEEIKWLAEPLAKIFIDLDWMDKIRSKGPYVEFGVAASIIVISRVRAHEKVKAERKKAAEKEKPAAPAKPPVVYDRVVAPWPPAGVAEEERPEDE